MDISLAAALAGVVALCKEVLPDRVRGWVTVVLTCVLGLLAGAFHFNGLNPATGLLTAFATVGGFSLVDRVGSK